MSIVGVVDPSHTETMYDVQGRFPRWYPPDELLQLARFKGPKWSSWTYETIRTTLSDHYEGNEHERVSVTTLLGCPRSVVLERKEPFIATLADLYPTLRGRMVHRTLEYGARPGGLAEAHFLTDLEGIELSCVIDMLTPEGDQYDYKLTDYAPNWYPYRSNTLQGMYNAYIARHATQVKLADDTIYTGEVPLIKSVSFVYLTPKKPVLITIEKKQKITTPNGKTIERKMPYVWTDDEVLLGEKKGEPGLIERVKVMRAALDSYPKFPKEAAGVWGGSADWRCPGQPICKFPNCLAKRWPHAMVWESPDE